MKCVSLKIRSRKYKKYFYCSKNKKEIMFEECKGCTDKEIKRKKTETKYMKKSKKARAVDISQRVKKAVFERDEGKCIICGNIHNVMPNAHYIPRSKGRFRHTRKYCNAVYRIN